MHLKNSKPPRVRKSQNSVPGEQCDTENRELVVPTQPGESVPAAQHDRQNLKPTAKQENNRTESILQQHLHNLGSLRAPAAPEPYADQQPTNQLLIPGPPGRVLQPVDLDRAIQQPHRSRPPTVRHRNPGQVPIPEWQPPGARD